MRAICNFFEHMSLTEAWENDESTLIKAGMSEGELAALRKVCNLEIGKPSDAFEFLAQRDVLVRLVYGEEETIPYYLTERALSRHAKTRHQEFGYQGSAINFSENANLAAYRLSKRYKQKDFIAASAASLCLIGKKYTASTNEHGMICFPNYSIVSAYIASAWLHHSGTTGSYAKSLVAAIYAHPFIFGEWLRYHRSVDGELMDLHIMFHDELLKLLNGEAIVASDTESLAEDLAGSTPTIYKVRRRDEKHIGKGLCLIYGALGWAR